MWFRARIFTSVAAVVAATAFGLSGPGTASAVVAADAADAARTPPPPPPPDRPGATDDGIAAPDRTALTSPPLHGELSALPPLPAPGFWAGACDADRHPANHRLGPASFRGVVACGPLDRQRPTGQVEPGESIGGGSTQYEWECVELVKRYMYLAGYISAAYPGNGKDIVANYPGGPHRLTAYHNVGRPGVTPQPGDVIAFGRGTTARYGHTALVVGSYVDPAGDGTINVLQENSNAHPTGAGALRVENWVVRAAAWDDAVDWLHDGRYPTYTGIGVSPAAAGGAVVDRDDTVRMVVGAGGVLRELFRPPGGGWTGFADASGPTVVGLPVSVVDRDGVLRVFAVDPRGAVHEHDRTADGWGPWSDLGGAVTGRPAAVADPDGAIRLLAVAHDRKVVENDQVNGLWRGWTATGATAAPGTDPAAVVAPDGTVREFVVDRNHQLRERGTRGGFAPVGGPVRATPFPVVDPAGTLRVFSLNAAGHAVATERRRDAAGWTAVDLGPAGAAPVATVDLAGTVHVFTTTGGGVRERTLPARTAAWTPWAGLGAGAAATALLGAAVDRSGTVYVFTRDRHGAVGIDETLATGGWTGVRRQPGLDLDAPPAVATAAACVRCLGRHDPARWPAPAGRTVCECRRRRGTRTR